MTDDVTNSTNIEHQRMISLINSMADAVIAVDENIDVVLFNGAALNILDVNNIQIGQPLAHYLHLLDKKSEKVDIRRVVKAVTTQQTSRDYIIDYGNQDKANIYISIAPVHLGFGVEGTKGFVLLLRDITHEKSLEEERDEFISVVSHELRTPIAIAEGNLSNALMIAEKENLADNIKDSISQSYDQIMLLSGMINDLATLSRAERGKLHFEIEDIDVASMINLLADEYQPQAEAKGLELRRQIDDGIRSLHSSKLYVREILQNFITNSIKYTEEGYLSIEAYNADGGIKFVVADSGIGISKTDIDKVFDKFFRSEDFRTRQNKGTGLGLYVTLKLTRLINADINVDSELNVGSTFSIFVPDIPTLS